MTDTLTKPPSILENPYKAIDSLGCGPGKPGARINSIVDATSINMLMSMHPRPPGVIKTTINIIYDKLIRELTRRGITSLSRQSDFIAFMRDCEIGLPGELLPGEPDDAATRPVIGSLPNGTVAGPLCEAPQPPVGRGETPNHPTAPGVPRQSSPVQPSSAPKQAGRGRKGLAQDRSV